MSKEKSGQANLKLELECEIRDKDGKLISIHRQESKSLLKNFMLLLYGIFYGTARSQIVSIKDTGNVARSFPFFDVATAIFLGSNAGAGVTDYGILVGSGTTAVTRDDYALATKIAHGSGAGQLLYGAETCEVPDGTPPATTHREIRVFTNNTGASITVYEIGLALDHRASGADWYFLGARDVLTTPQTIPAGATLTVRYIFSVTA